MMYFEDIPLEVTTELGSHTFTEDEIITFAKEWDPQPIHVDPVAAKESPFGGLIASGWHLCAIWMRLMVGHRTRERAAGRGRAAAGVSPGFLDLEWLAPVRPGDTITYRSTTKEKVDLKSRPKFGILKSLNEGINQDGVQVLSFIGLGFLPRRPKE